MLYFENVWVAALTDSMVRRVCTISEKLCPAHKAGLKSPILHLCHQDSLLDKLGKHFHTAQGELLRNLDKEYDIISSKLPKSDKPEDDRQCYVSCGRSFLLTVTPEALYYGRYIGENDDKLIYTKTVKKRKLN
jgi:hypothetical protein|eukprot:sb/3474861/